METMRIIPIMVGHDLEYEVRSANGQRMLHTKNERDAKNWCREKDVPYLITNCERPSRENG